MKEKTTPDRESGLVDSSDHQQNCKTLLGKDMLLCKGQTRNDTRRTEKDRFGGDDRKLTSSALFLVSYNHR